MLSAWQSGFADHYMKYTFILLHSAQWHYLSKFLPLNDTIHIQIVGI